MVHNTSFFKDQDVQLRTALSGLLVSTTTNISVQDGNGVESLTYLLPIETCGADVYGAFNIDGNVDYLKIGLKRKNGLFSTEFYNFNNEGSLDIIPKVDFKNLYLPLIDTNHKFPLLHDGERLSGSPFPWYGLNGNEGTLPLSLVLKTDKWSCLLNCYLTSDGGLNTACFTRDKFNEEIENYLRNSKHIIVPGADLIKEVKTNVPVNWKDPKAIVDYLNQEVIKQDQAKKVAAVITSNYMVRKETGNEFLPKDCFVLIGPTGTGKTLIIQTLAKTAEIPFAKISLSGKSAEGYMGGKITDAFKDIHNQSDEEAPYGIIFFDELCKTVSDDGFNTGFGPKLQNELIGWIEGDRIKLSYEGEKNRKEVYMDTKNLMFVFAGSFGQSKDRNTLETIIKKRLGVEQTIGFGSEQKVTETDYTLRLVEPQDLIEFGLKPELVGRISSRVTLEELTCEDKVKILKESKSSAIKKYVELTRVKGYDIEVEDAVLEIIANHCPTETGARELNTICSNLFIELLYDPKVYSIDGKINLTAKLAEELLSLNVSNNEELSLSAE